jgi:glycosyltransferase involved in cell wall biosynthesis
VARASQHFALERAGRIVTNTEDYARHTRSLLDRAEKVGWILPPIGDLPDSGTAPDVIRRQFGITGAPVVFFLGRFAEEKGLPVLLSAFPEIRRRHPGAMLVLGGAHDVPGESVRERIDPLLADPASGVLATGAVSPETLAGLFAIADVLVLPSVNSTESFGIVQVEAMLSGVPVVASDLPGVREPVRMTGMGEIARAGDAADLARQVLVVLDSPQRYRRPRSEVRALFSTDRTLAEYEAVYASVAGTGG